MFSSLMTDIRKFDFIRHLFCFFSLKTRLAFLNDVLRGSGEGGGFTCKFDIWVSIWRYTIELLQMSRNFSTQCILHNYFNICGLF